MPELQIISNDLWDQAQSLKARLGARPPNQRRRPKRLLSGLVKCGCCEGAFTVIGEDRFGCSAYREGRSCQNNRTISARKLEDRVLAGVKEKLLTPDMLSEFTKQVQAELNEHSRRQNMTHSQLQSERSKISESLKLLVSAIEQGSYSKEILSRIDALETRRDQIEAELAAAPVHSIISVLPNAPEVYRQKVENLREALNKDDETRGEAIKILRSVVNHIVIHKRQGRGNVAIELYGSLSRLLELSGHENISGSDVMTMVVTEE